MIPKTIINILKNKSVTIYGDGSNVRNWLFVEDHVECLIKLFDYNGPIRQFLTGSEIELDNNKLVRLIFEKLKSISRMLSNSVERVITSETCSDDRLNKIFMLCRVKLVNL